MYQNFSIVVAINSVLDQTEIFDAHTLLARYYDPVIGEFTSFDSFEGDQTDPIHLHKYLYAGANPVMYVDPSGHDFSLISLGITTAIGATIGATAGFTYATVFKHLPVLSVQTLEYTLGGGLAGGLLAGTAYIAATAGVAGGLQLLRSGATQLLAKLALPHSTTETVALSGFALGLIAGIVEPDPTLLGGAAVSTIVAAGPDIIVRGVMRNRSLLIGEFGAAGYQSVRAILFTYGQSTTFFALGFTIGFTSGYAVGYDIRKYVIDPLIK